MGCTTATERSSRSRRVAAAMVTAGCLVITPGAYAATVGGGAFAVKANVNALGIPADVGPLPSVTLPSTGSAPLTATLVNTSVLGLATIKSGDVSTEGDAEAGTADSSAMVADVDVLGLVKARVASSTCSATTSEATGSSKVVGLEVAGLSLAIVDIGPNTKISLPVGTVTLNEQITTSTQTAARSTARSTVRSKVRSKVRSRAHGSRKAVRTRRAATRATTTHSITVNAVHVQLNALGLATGDVILGQSRCRVG